MSQCATCHAGCCRSFAVPVTGADVLRIVSQVGREFWDFACRWADPAGSIAQNHAPHFHFRDEPRTPFVICLLHEPSVQFPGTARCTFLKEGEPAAEHSQSQGRCGIYEQRPAACRAFPAKLAPTPGLAVLYDVPAYGRAGENPAYRLCANRWEPGDLDPVQHVQDLVVAKFEMDFFHLLAQRWNRQPGDWEAFPDFLQLVYSRRILPVPEVESEELPATIAFPRSKVA